ncbi:MAG: HAMP domain-containing protein [Gemmatimonadales bacterium]|nr:HAMP domain-containing protein [Gemmatimonadales bacterium]
MSERRLSRVLTDRIGRLIWWTLAGYAALVVVLFAGLSELALQRSLEQSADVVQSLIGLYADPAGERTTVAPEMLAERLIGTGEPFLITRATSSGRAGGGRTIYFLSPSLPAKQVESPEAGVSGDAVREQLVRALAERGRWRHAILRRRVGEFDIFVARRRDPYLLALAGLAAAVLLLLPVAAFLARRSMTRAVSSALVPLSRVVDETRRIGPQDLSGRVPAPTGIAEVSELSEALNRLLERVERSHRALEGFTADASHELRTPLTHIRAQAQWALDDRRNRADEREALAGIARETEGMIRMVEDLLLIARGENQQLAIASGDFDLAEVVREVEEIAAAIAKDRDLDVRAEVDGPVHAIGDAGRTREILLNLASNAVRHTGAGSVVLTRMRGDGMVGIAVRDTGCGIEPQQLSRIFDRFYRVDRSRSRTQGGAGLGLTIARLLAELQHGRIEVESTPGKGSVFVLWLPSPEPLPADESRVRIL